MLFDKLGSYACTFIKPCTFDIDKVHPLHHSIRNSVFEGRYFYCLENIIHFMCNVSIHLENQIVSKVTAANHNNFMLTTPSLGKSNAILGIIKR